jgi:hypothetical protein
MDARRARSPGCPSFWFVFLTSGILPFALRAGFAVRAAPAAQWASKKDELAREAGEMLCF